MNRLRLPGGGVAHSAAHCVRASAGSVSGLLFRSAAETSTDDGTRLDTLLHSYRQCGALAGTSLGGAFVLLLIDEGARRVLLATDRFAICPVYHHAAATHLAFASHLDALIMHPRIEPVLDPQAVYDYVFFHCIPSPRTIYRDVAKLGPAEALEWSPTGQRCASYWKPRFAATDAGPEVAGPKLVAALEMAVASRARPRCGTFLSGGLDSSSVAGLLKRVRGEAATFTIGFDAVGYDESAYARIVTRHFAADHHEYFVTPADVADALPRIAAHYGEPFGNSSVIPTYYCARLAREHGVDLMLAGDGGDELFAGNTRYVAQRTFERYFRVPAIVRSALESGYRLIPLLAALPIAGKGARYIQQAKMGLPDRLQSYNFLHRFDPRSIFDCEWLSTVDVEAPWRQWRDRYAAPEHGDALQRMLYLDWKFTLADNDLVKVNNMCELGGVEVCYPMLDDAVVELAAGLSSATLLLDGKLRGFYKHAFQGILPRETIVKPKHGFGLPFGVWMKQDRHLLALTADALAALGERRIFQREFLERTRMLHREGNAAGYYGELVWILTVLELWLATHEI